MATTTCIPLHEPCLARVAEMLAARHCTGRMLDLSGVMVVLPGQRAGRRLLELLCEQVAQKTLVLMPPRTVTVSRFCKCLAESACATPHAEPLELVCAWMEAMAAAPADVRAYFAPADGGGNDATDVFRVAQMLAGLHAELAGERIAPATLAGMSFDDEKESDRWRAFDALASRCRQVLDRHTLADPYDAVERALTAGGACLLPDVRMVYAVGIVDFHQQFAAALEAVADRLVIVPHGEQEWFENNGRLKAGSPLDTTHSSLDDQHVHVAANATAQARTALQVLAGLNGQYGHADITIGVPDSAVEHALQQALQDAGIAAHSALGIPFMQTELGRLVACMTALVETRAYSLFLEFIRYPLCEAWLRTQPGCTDSDEWVADLLFQAESYAQKHVVEVTTEDWRASRSSFDAVRLALDHVNGLLSAFDGEKPLNEWPDICNKTLARLFSTEVPGMKANRHHLAAIQAWCALMDSVKTARVICAGKLPAATALHWFMSLLRQETITADSESVAVDLVGWLELALDDAPVIVATGMNEGVVPSPGTSDPFLPNTIREKLGLQHDGRRLRRDRYLLRSLEQGARVLHVVCGRREDNNNPLFPSRLLFDAPEERTAVFVRTFYGEVAAPASAPLVRPSAPPAAHAALYSFAPPKPDKLARPVQHLSATDIGTYLKCPYCFHLNNEKLQEPPELIGEIDQAQLGNLIHDALAAWGGEKKNVAAESQEDILDRLLPLFHSIATARLGASPHPAVRLQVKSCEHRLFAFACAQATETKAGWRIDPDCVEHRISFSLEAAATAFTVTGRIDRIDRKGSDVRILDYKTGTASTPEAKHQEKQQWVDVQLPLYAVWLRRDQGVLPSAGYFNMPDSSEKTGVLMAKWTVDDLESALDAARTALKGIAAAAFPRTDDTKRCARCPYATICQRPHSTC